MMFKSWSAQNTQNNADLPGCRLRADFGERRLGLFLFHLVRQQHDGRGVVGDVLLHDAVEADAVFAEGVAQGADYAWSVFGFEPDVVSVDGLSDGVDVADLRADGQLEVAREVGQFQRAGEIDDVAHDCAGGGEAARARAVKHDLADRAAFDEDGVVDAFDAGQRVMARHECRMDAHVQRLTWRRVVLVAGLRQTDHLDAVSEFRREADVQIADGGDALAVDLFDFDRDLERERREDGDFVSHVAPLDVVGRIGFGEPGGLGLGERFGERLPLALHLRQDVVGRAVDDAGDARDAVGLQPPLQGRDQRDAAPDRRFEENRNVVAVGQVEYLGAMFGDQLFVGRDDVFPVRDRAFDNLISRVNAARDLDQNLYLRVVGELERVVGDFELREVDVARFIAVAHRDGAYLKLGVAAEQRYDAGAYRSQAKNTKNRFCSHNQRSLTGHLTGINVRDGKREDRGCRIEDRAWHYAMTLSSILHARSSLFNAAV